MIIDRRKFIEMALKTGGGLYLGANGLLMSGCDRPEDISAIPVNGKFKRVILLGMDGLDPKVLSELMDRGDMPNFKSLAGKGTISSLATSIPPQSPTAWSTIATGMNPGHHGVFDFISSRRTDYIPELAVLRRNPKNLLGKRESMFLPVMNGAKLWEETSSAGVASTVVRWPITFPPGDSDAKLFAGLGVPDITGGLGRYTFYTSKERIDEYRNPGKVIQLDIVDGEAETSIKGPKVAKLMKKKDATADLSIRILPDASSAALTIDGVKSIVKAGHWSEWMTVGFDTGLINRVSGMVKFYLNAVTPDIELYMTSVELDPADPAFVISNPDDYVKELERDLGRFHTLGIPEDTRALSDGVIDEEAFIGMCHNIVDEQERMLAHELGRFKQGLLSFIFFTTDRIQHIFWGTRDPEHPGYDVGYAKKYGEVINDFYRRMDRILGDTMKHVDDSTAIILFSDHGFTTFRRSVSINSWLVKNGFMTLEDGSASGDENAGALFSNVDWSRTRAYALGFSSIYLNLKGRESEGIVAPGAEEDALIDEIRNELLKLKDPKGGGPVVQNVYRNTGIYTGPKTELASDIIIGFHEGYRMSWQTAIGGTPDAVFEDNMKKWTGDHIMDPSNVPGILLTNFAVKHAAPGLTDIAPTVLSCFGLSADKSEGRPLI